ncbi:MAG: hypothetical protein IJD63_02935 [Oscillospiraceae bacterium]|nr:hypothetical protein [Oscillospiraceae bacterium]
MKALLIGRCPPRDLGYTYGEGPYDAVVIGSLTLGQLLGFQNEEALCALAMGKPVVLYTPGLPEAPKNRALAAALASKRRELKNWGVLFVDGTQKRLVTATEAQKMRQAGKRPDAGAVLTPLAREILEGSD